MVICAMILLFLLVTAYFQPRGVQRALGLFLVTYCLVASFTEVGFTDASTYLLELTLAASLLVPPLAGSETRLRLMPDKQPLPSDQRRAVRILRMAVLCDCSGDRIALHGCLADRMAGYLRPASPQQ